MTMQDDDGQLKTRLQNFDPQDGPGNLAVLLLDMADACPDDADGRENRDTLEVDALVMTFLDVLSSGRSRSVLAFTRYMRKRLLDEFDPEA